MVWLRYGIWYLVFPEHAWRACEQKDGPQVPGLASPTQAGKLASWLLEIHTEVAAEGTSPQSRAFCLPLNQRFRSRSAVTRLRQTGGADHRRSPPPVFISHFSFQGWQPGRLAGRTGSQAFGVRNAPPPTTIHKSPSTSGLSAQLGVCSTGNRDHGEQNGIVSGRAGDWGSRQYASHGEGLSA